MYDKYKNVDDRLEAWKKGVEGDFKQWVNDLTEIPEVNLSPDAPDIYSFYQELCVLRNEIRTGGRRSQEVLTHFGESLSGFQQTVKNIETRLCSMDNEKSADGLDTNKSIFVPLVNILERMERLKDRLESPPENTIIEDCHADCLKVRFIRFLEKRLLSFSYNHKKLEEAWNRFKDGFEITLSHLDSLLKKEGVSRVITIGMPFDPALMTAVAVEYTEKYQEYLVLEEISPGFLLNNFIIKLAEVKISRKKECK